MRATIFYAIWRVLLFAAPFALLYVVGWTWYIALIVALVFSLAASYIFLGKLRRASAEELASRRALPHHDDDEDAEDEVLDEHGMKAQTDSDAETPDVTDEPDADDSADDVAPSSER